MPLLVQQILGTGNAANHDWFTAANWSENAVPTSCHQVIIPNGATCNIPMGMTGECKFIEIDINVSFEVQGLLTVHGN